MTAPQTGPDSAATATTDTDPAVQTWDVIVIGAGPPGENAAQYAIQGSDRTAVLIEAELVGGECSFWACMPSKGLLRPVDLAHQAAKVPGLTLGPIDVRAVLAHRDEITHNRDDTSQVDWATSVGIDVVRGRARLDGPRQVVVQTNDGSTRTLRARTAVVLATGTTAAVPPTDGLAAAKPWTSRDVTNLTEVPKRVVIIGGGVVACEAATWLNGLGAQVTILQRGDALLATNEPFAGDMVAEQLRGHGVTIRFGAKVTAVRRPGVADTGYGRIHGGPVEVDFDNDDGGETITADEIVVATGRVPASKDIGLDTVGLADDGLYRGGYVAVDDHLTVTGIDQAGDEWLYVIGDLNGRALLTHMGKYQARICGAVISARANGSSVDGAETTDRADHGGVTQVTFTDPQVASVGLTEARAREAGIVVRTVEYDMANVAGASVQQTDYKGRAQIVVDETNKVIVGATFVGPEVGELLHSAVIAVVGRVPLDTLWHAVPAYPTVSEVWLRLLETYRTT
ncbi:MAG: hypothetical protein QOK15_2533 [Nocardioidaceae bacterium]|nr:hypothetical protein [Nocardioidaceae bacterium]